MKVKLVFDRWQKNGRNVSDEKSLELSRGDFHSGSTFPGSIQPDADGEADLEEAMKAGYEPVFALKLVDVDAGGEIPMKAGNIPGWEKCDGADVGAQMVFGEWYRPSADCNSLQEFVEDYLDVWQTVYVYLTYGKYRGGKKRGACVSAGREAILKLREWGMVDDNGDLIER